MTSKNVNRILLPKSSRQQIYQEHNNQSIKQKQKISQKLKQKYIQDLEQRNRKLKNQILKITNLLEQNEQKQKLQKQKQDPKKFKSKIAQTLSQNNPQVLKKQVENVYKQIKNYERQIEKVQTKGGSRLASDQIAKLQLIKLQKLQHLDKLRTSLAQLNNKQLINSKKLKNNMGRQYYQTQIIKLGEQLKILREKARAAQQKQRKKVQNAKKQFQYIKKLQAQLVQAGIAMDQIQQMKRKNVYVQVKNIMNRQKSYSKSEDQNLRINGIIEQQQQEQEEIITNQKLQEMKNQIKMFQKLHQDYQKRLDTLQKQKQNSDKIILQKKNTIQDRNNQIQKLNQEINQVKQIVRKNNMPNNGTFATVTKQNQSLRKLQKRKSIEVPNKSLQKSKNKNIQSFKK